MHRDQFPHEEETVLKHSPHLARPWTNVTAEIADEPPTDDRCRAAYGAVMQPVLPDGVVVVVKRDCATCEMVIPVLAQLREVTPTTVYVQDDPTFFSGLDPLDDTSLAVSWHYDLDTVPTVIMVRDGQETGRTVGWDRACLLYTSDAADE